MKRDHIFLFIIYTLIISLNFWFKDHLILGSQELRLWGSLARNISAVDSFDFFLTTMPLGLSNILGLFFKFFGGNFLFFSVLSITLFFILIRSSFQNKSIPQLLLSGLCFLNPLSLWVIISRPVDTFIMIILFLFTRGLLMTDSKNLGRGLLMMSFSSLFLILSGRLGIAFLFSVFCLLPFFLRTEIFHRSTIGGYFLITFPTIAAFTGVLYLSWLYQIEFKKLLIGDPYKVSRLLESLDIVIIFMMGLSLWLTDKSQGVIRFIQDQKGILTLILTTIVFYFFGEGCPYDVIIGIGMVALGIGFTNRKKVDLKSFFPVILINFTIWISFFQSDQLEIKKFYSQRSELTTKAWNKINQRIENSNHTLIASEHFSFFILNQKKQGFITPIDKNFDNLILTADFSGFEYILVENPHLLAQDKITVQSQISKLYFFPPETLQTVYADKHFKLLRSRSYPLYSVYNESPRSGLISYQNLENWFRLFVLFVIFFLSFNFMTKKNLQDSAN